jgi:hypothetical protein
MGVELGRYSGPRGGEYVPAREWRELDAAETSQSREGNGTGAERRPGFFFRSPMCGSRFRLDLHDFAETGQRLICGWPWCRCSAKEVGNTCCIRRIREHMATGMAMWWCLCTEAQTVPYSTRSNLGEARFRVAIFAKCSARASMKLRLLSRIGSYAKGREAGRPLD